MGLQIIPMPRAKPLAVASQRGVLMLWALIDPSTEARARRILVIETGTPGAPSTLEHIGTVLMQDDNVLHVFDLGELH